LDSFVLRAQMLKVAASYERMAAFADDLTDDGAEREVQTLR